MFYKQFNLNHTQIFLLLTSVSISQTLTTRIYHKKSSQYNRTKSKLQNFLWVHKHEIEIDVRGITSSEYFNRQYYKIIRDFYCNIHYADTHNENISQKAHNITEQSQNFKFFHKLTNIKTLPMCRETYLLNNTISSTHRYFTFSFWHQFRGQSRCGNAEKAFATTEQHHKFINFLWVHKHKIEIDVQGNMFSKYFNHHYYKIIHDFYCDVHYADTHSENISQKKKAHIETEQSQIYHD